MIEGIILKPMPLEDEELDSDRGAVAWKWAK